MTAEGKALRGKELGTENTDECLSASGWCYFDLQTVRTSLPGDVCMRRVSETHEHEARGGTSVRRQRPTPAAAAVGGRSPLAGAGAERPRRFRVATPPSGDLAAHFFARVPARGGPAGPICSACALTRRDARAGGGPGAPCAAPGSGARRARSTAVLPGASAPGCAVHTGSEAEQQHPFGASRAALSRRGPQARAAAARRQAPRTALAPPRR